MNRPLLPIAALALLAGAGPQEERVPWTASKITGSPEPPAPVRPVRVFPKLTFKKPLHLVPFPGHKRWVVIEEEGTLWTIPNDDACEKSDLLIDLKKEIRDLDKVERVKGVASSYAIAFDPGFEKNRTCYLMYVLDPKDKKAHPAGSRVSRFRMTDAEPPRIDPASEEVLVTWLSGGHNGCDLQFGNDGFLYISTGDAEDPSPPDKLRTGQDCSDLLSSILRIDVRKAGAGRPYAIPPDNPFVAAEGVRPEIWCYGFRNPWRMSFDRATGRLWIGDVGWERWELVMCGERGANFGWSIVEGPTPCLPDAKHGPTPIVPVAHAIPHPEAASITGGFVYRGRRLKGYEGKYVYGDWDTRRIWANPVRGNTLGDREEIARTALRIVAFAEEADGELLVVDHEKGGIYRLEPNDGTGHNPDFPRALSRTGLFTSLPAQAPSPGVIPYAINAPRWADGAAGERWIALPGRESIRHVDKNKEWPKESTWPTDSVLAKTYALEGRKVETQVLHYDGIGWNGYSYVWNEAQTDAALAPAAGAEIGLGAGRTWKVPPRAACISCHNPWPGYALTLSRPQLERPREGGGQIEIFQRWGLLPKDLPKAKPLVEPSDEAAPLADRARAYLAANCAHCHRFGGGGSARIDLRHEIALAEMRAHGVRPTLGGFDLADAHLVAGGDPSRSVLLYRISKLGQGRMPHGASDVVDVKGVDLIRRWIASLPAVPNEAASARAEDARALERARAGEPPALDRLLAAPTGALDLLSVLEALPESVRKEAIRRALDLPPGPVRDLYERFEPPSQRRRRLGTAVRPEQVLGVKGDTERGRKLFASPTVQCGRCHRMGEGPEKIGADLSKVGARYTRAQLLESILEPSKLVDPKYAGYVVQTRGGDVFSAILVSKSEKELVFRDVEKEIRLEPGKIQGMVQQQASLMPEGLLQHLTAQEAADLLAYLESLR